MENLSMTKIVCPSYKELDEEKYHLLIDELGKKIEGLENKVFDLECKYKEQEQKYYEMKGKNEIMKNIIYSIGSNI